MKRIILLLIAGIAVTFGLVASASATSVTSQIRITGLGYSSLGAGVIVDDTPGFETLVLGNYAYSSKNLKGYTVKDKAGNVVSLCALNVDCESLTLDADADGIPNKNDMDAWLTLGARSQKIVNLEIRNDGPLLNDGGDTLYLRNSVGRVLSIFKYSVSNPTG